MNAVGNWEEIPLFDSEEAEAAFWAENRPDLRLMEMAVALFLMPCLYVVFSSRQGAAGKA